MLGELIGAPAAAAALAPGARPSLCVILDGRGGAAGGRAELLRLWLVAMEELLALRPEPLPDLSIVTVHEDYYESSLPLGQHTLGAVQAALKRLEHEWVLAPMGLAGAPWADGDGLLRGGGLLPERAVDLLGAAPLRPRGAAEPAGRTPGAKRPRKAAETPARRLFAAGEDAALAALRSATAQLAQPASRALGAQPGQLRPDRRLELWTAAPERLAAAAAACAAPLRGGPADGVEVLIVAAMGAGTGGTAQRAARAQLLAAELPEAFGLRALPLAPGAFARQVRTHVGRELHVRLKLPAAATPRELQLAATPAALLQPTWQLAGGGAPSGLELKVVCRVPAAGVSCELLYGVPLLAGVAPGTSIAAAGALEALVRELEKREECLLLCAGLSPLSLAPTQCAHYFLALPAQGRQPLLVLRGAASADVWQPAAMLVEGRVGEPPAPQAADVGKDWPALDPYELCRERAARAEGMAWGGW